MIEFLLIVYFPCTKNYQSVFLFLNSVSNTQYTILYIYIYIVYVPQYPTRGETTREYLETRSDKSILSNSLCDLASIILKKNRQLKYHQKRGFAIGAKCGPPYSNLLMTELEREFSKTVSLNLSRGYDTSMRFLVYGPKFSNN